MAAVLWGWKGEIQNILLYDTNATQELEIKLSESGLRLVLNVYGKL